MPDPTTLSDDPTPRLAEQYSSSAEEYARLWSPVIRPMGQRLLHTLPLVRAARILDVGAGTGALLPDIRAAAPRATVIGVDRSEGMLRIAQAATSVPLAVMDAQRLALWSDRFDVAVLAFVLFHLPDPVRGLAEVARALRPGGLVGTTTWGQKVSFAASDVWDEELEAHGAGPDPAAQFAQNEKMDSPEKVRALLEQAGFVSVQTWAERFEHRWDREGLFALRVGCGGYRRRLETLDADARAACLARIRVRLAPLPPDAFIYRPEVIFGVAVRP